MNILKKLFAGGILASLLVASAVAADTIVTNAPVTTPAASLGSLFNAKEFGVSLASGYTVDRANLFKQAYNLNLNAGVFYFPWRNFGFEANVPFYQTKGVSVDEVQVGAIFRLPLARTTPVLKNLAPYLGLDAVYNWQTSQNWAYIAKVGTEFRLNSKWSTFVEGQYRNRDFDWNNGQTSLNGGLRLVF